MYNYGSLDIENIFGKEKTALLLKELSHLFQSKQTHQAAATNAPCKIDVSNYTDPQQFALEKKILFRETPLMMGLSCELPNPGDYITKENTEVPILIVRNAEGKVNAFFNACRHRAARLKSDEKGHCNQLVCPFHGWTYDLDGKLLRIFTENKFGHIDKSAHGLIELPAAEKYGMIFVRPTPGPAIDINTLLGEKLAKQLQGWDLSSLVPFGHYQIETETSWKMALDSNFESYHVFPLHPNTLAPFSAPETMVYERYGPGERHFSTFHALPAIENLTTLPESEWNVLELAAFVYFIFPNVILAPGNYGLNYVEIYPGNEPGRQMSSLRQFTRYKIETPEDLASNQAMFSLFYQVVRDEDYGTAANIYKSLRSGLHPYSLFGRNELALTGMHEKFREAIGLDPKGLYYRGK